MEKQGHSDNKPEAKWLANTNFKKNKMVSRSAPSLTMALLRWHFSLGTLFPSWPVIKFALENLPWLPVNEHSFSKGLKPLQGTEGMEFSQETVVFGPGSGLRKSVGLPGMQKLG